MEERDRQRQQQLAESRKAQEAAEKARRDLVRGVFATPKGRKLLKVWEVAYCGQTIIRDRHGTVDPLGSIQAAAESDFVKRVQQDVQT